jgi:hypothetical protein
MASPNRGYDEEYWAKVHEARLTPPEEKFLAGPRLFDAECRAMAEALRAFCPYADEYEVQVMLREIAAWRRHVERSPCPIYTS